MGKKRIVSAFLVLLMILSTIPFGILRANAVTASWKIYDTTEITDTNAKISTKVTFSSKLTCTEGGFYIGTSSNNLRKNAYPDKNFSITSTYICSTFLMSKYKETLSPNTTYYFKVYVIANGTTFTSPVGSFKTTSSASWKANDITNLSPTDAKISTRVDFPQSRTFTEGGFYLGTASNNLKKNAYPDVNFTINSSYLVSSFLMSKYKETLTPNTTYYYQVYVIANGTTYKSPIYNFKTPPAPTQAYTLSYNANGGSGAPAAQSGASTYKISDTVPTRSGYTFLGWAKSSSAAAAEYASGASITITANTTLYAVWKSNAGNPYNLGDETYSFSNPYYNGTYNCFGMSATSSGFYIGALDITSVGAASGTIVNALTKTTKVLKNINHYQRIQGSPASKAVVAGGRYYIGRAMNINSDWTEVINYVKSHAYDEKGNLQISMRYPNCGHAVSFIRYSVVDGQDRLYCYDSNFPTKETYIYRDSSGKVLFTGATGYTINSIALRDMVQYFKYTDGFDQTRVLYSDTACFTIEGVEPYYMDCDPSDEYQVMYELPEDAQQITIIPLEDGAYFEYMDEEYAFGEVTEDTCGIFTLYTEDDTAGAVSAGPGLTIVDTSGSAADLEIAVDSAEVKAGESFTVCLNVKEPVDIKSLAISELTFDNSKLTLTGGEWLLENTVISNWNTGTKTGVAGYNENTPISGDFFKLSFVAAENISAGETSISCTITANSKPAGGTEGPLSVEVIPGNILIFTGPRGDMNGDEMIDSDDAIYLLYHTLLPGSYPISQKGDVNDDGVVDSDDAIYLLYYTLLPDAYPLY